MDLQLNKAAVIMGASRGIGPAIAQVLSAEGIVWLSPQARPICWTRSCPIPTLSLPLKGRGREDCPPTLIPC
jgi:hypothetical protein